MTALLAGCDAAGVGKASEPSQATSGGIDVIGRARQSVARLRRYVMERTRVGEHTVVTPPARFVKLEVLSELHGGPWASIAEFNLLDAAGNVLSREGWRASADSEGTSERASHAIDGDRDSLWHTQWEGVPAPMPHALVLDLGQPQALSGFRLLPRQDRSRNGAVARFRFYVSQDGRDWGVPVEQGTLANAGDAMAERSVVFGHQLPNQAPTIESIDARSAVQDEPVSFAVKASDADGDALVFAATGLPPGLSIDAATGVVSGRSSALGRHAAVIQVEDERGAATSVAMSWTIVAPPPPPEDAVRFVRLEAISEIHGQPWAAVAELNLLDDNGASIPRDGWKASADSEATSSPASAAIDGDDGTLWHTKWEGDAPRHPHALTIDLGRRVVINGFRYLPRQDGTDNGDIARYRFYTSKDGLDWGTPIVTGDFSSLGDPNVEKTVYLK